MLRTPLEERELDIHGFVMASVSTAAPGDARLGGRSRRWTAARATVEPG